MIGSKRLLLPTKVCVYSVNLCELSYMFFLTFTVLAPAGPVNGNWGQWADTTTCTKTCGSGTLTRLRTCSNPAPSNGGQSCLKLDGVTRASTETQTNHACNTQACIGKLSIF